MSEAVEGEVVVPAELQTITAKDHPHFGEAGWLEKDTLQHTTGQYYFKLSNCQHGTAGCYVLESDLRTAEATLETEENLTNLTPFDPYKHSDETEAKLIEAFGMSYNIREACQYAGISHVTFYEWIKQIDGFEARMEEAKAAPLKKAKSVINTALQSGDVNTAKWYVERRDPDFKPKAEVDNNIGIQETRKKIGDFLNERSADDFSEQPSATASETTGGEIPQPPTDIS